MVRVIPQIATVLLASFLSVSATPTPIHTELERGLPTPDAMAVIAPLFILSDILSRVPNLAQFLIAIPGMADILSRVPIDLDKLVPIPGLDSPILEIPVLGGTHENIPVDDLKKCLSLGTTACPGGSLATLHQFSLICKATRCVYRIEGGLEGFNMVDTNANDACSDTSIPVNADTATCLLKAARGSSEDGTPGLKILGILLQLIAILLKLIKLILG